MSEVQLFDNYSSSPFIGLNERLESEVSRSLLENHMCLSVNDRIEQKLNGGFAFYCIDGTGISIRYYYTDQEPDAPPLTDVLIRETSSRAVVPPRYSYSVIIPRDPDATRELHFSSEFFHPGTQGIAKIELPQ